MPPVSPGQPSSFGSVFVDSPGLLRETGFTQQFNITPSATGQGYAICSSTAGHEVSAYQTVIAPLEPGDSMSIFGIQGVGASNTTPLLAALKTGPFSTDATNPTLLVLSANRNGPWFDHFELPIRIDGPATGTKEVYIYAINAGATPGLNRVTLEVLVYRKP